MKYLLLYQILTKENAFLEQIYQLNNNYRSKKNTGNNNTVPNQDSSTQLYKNFLPDHSEPYYLLTDEKNNVFHLKSDIKYQSEFKVKIASNKISLSKEQANFRIIQNFAWASQFKEKRYENAKSIALVYVYRISDSEYLVLSSKCKSQQYSSYDKQFEISKLQKKHANSLPKDYLAKNIHRGITLPDTSNLIGVFNPTSGPQNKCIIFASCDGKSISKGESLFITSAKTSLLGYVPGRNNLNITSYNTFQTPVINLNCNTILLCNSNDSDSFETGMVKTVVYKSECNNNTDVKYPSVPKWSSSNNRDVFFKAPVPSAPTLTESMKYDLDKQKSNPHDKYYSL